MIYTTIPWQTCITMELESHHYFGRLGRENAGFTLGFTFDT